MSGIFDSAVQALDAFRGVVAVGDVFVLPSHHAGYWESQKSRPAVIARLQRAGDGTPVKAFLFFGTTGSVPGDKAVSVPADEADLAADTTFDLRRYKELTVVELFGECTALGRLNEATVAQIEAILADSDFPFKGLAR